MSGGVQGGRATRPPTRSVIMLGSRLERREDALLKTRRPLWARCGVEPARSAAELRGHRLTRSVVEFMPPISISSSLANSGYTAEP